VSDAFAAAIEYHRSHETRWRRDFLTDDGRYIGVADEPAAVGDVLGPVLARGGPNGVIRRGGEIVAEWGEVERVDMSFSIAKTYLAVLAGVAIGRGLIRNVDDRVSSYRLDESFATAQNRNITWRHLLQQTSEWQGTLWGKPDTIDHNRDVGKSELGHSDKGRVRPMRPPGTLWEYNDVRVNRLGIRSFGFSASRWPTCCAARSWIRSERRATGSGSPIGARRSRSTAAACRPSPAAHTGAAGSGCRAAITPASDHSSRRGDGGTAARCCRRNGSPRCAGRAP